MGILLLEKVEVKLVEIWMIVIIKNNTELL